MPEIGNSSVWKQADADNTTGTQPSWSGAASPDTIDNAGRAMMGAITREWNWRSFTVSTTGSSNAFVLTYSVAPAALYNGQRFGFITNHAVTGAATLNINSIGAKDIVKDVGGTLTALASGDAPSGVFMEVAYNTSADKFVWINRGQIPSSYYSPGGTDVALADGGTGASLTDPGADRIMFWDDSGSAVTWLTVGSGLAISTTTMAVDIAGLSADATPDTAADYVMTLDATDSTLKKVLIDDFLPVASTASGCDTIVLEAALSGASVTWNNTVVTRVYKAFKVIIDGASIDSSGSMSLAISGNNGSGSTTIWSASATSGASSINASIDITNADDTSGNRPVAAVTVDSAGATALDVSALSVTTGAINWLRMSTPGGDAFDSGTVTIIGYY